MANRERRTLSRERVLEGAVALADEIGLEALTIRRLAEALDTKPMTIYYHVPSKDDIIDGMVEAVFSQIDKPPAEIHWKSAMRARCMSAREVIRRHAWVAPLMESRTSPGPENLAHHEAVLACLRRGGLSYQLMAHAYAMLDAFVYGFAFQEASLPAQLDGDFVEVARDIAAAFDVDAYPRLVEFSMNHVFRPGYDFGDSFEFGLDLILDGIEQAADLTS